jgi:hypothetical protein
LTNGIENPKERRLIFDPVDQYFEHFLSKIFDGFLRINIDTEPGQPPIQQ